MENWSTWKIIFNFQRADFSLFRLISQNEKKYTRVVRVVFVVDLKIFSVHLFCSLFTRIFDYMVNFPFRFNAFWCCKWVSPIELYLIVEVENTFWNYWRSRVFNMFFLWFLKWKLRSMETDFYNPLWYTVF